ncbi:MAG: TorF family putative porin [Nevskia sp.]|nr:TorF family putative porin [Nevskia sp.]
MIVRVMRKGGRCVLLPAALACAGPAGAQGWGGSLGVSSDNVYRGQTQSHNEPSGQADLHYYGRSGWFAGLSASSIKRSPYDSTSAEFEPYLGWQWQLTDPWSARVAAVHHDYPWNNPGRRYNYDELTGTVGYADRAFLTVAASPDVSIDGPYASATGRAALVYELALHQPLQHALSVNAGVGYYDLRWAAGTGYVYWNAGLGWDLGRVQLDLSYLGTDGVARHLFYSGVAVNRLVATALWHF